MGTGKPDLAGVVTDPTLAQRCDLGIIIFVRNFPSETDEENLYSLFSPFGVVRKVSEWRQLPLFFNVEGLIGFLLLTFKSCSYFSTVSYCFDVSISS